MYSSFQLARKFLHYRRTAMNGKGHGMHSPFVFNFIRDVLNNRQRYTPPYQVEVLRKKLLCDSRVLHVHDLGAGSRSSATSERLVRKVAATSVKPKKYGQLLYRLAHRYRPATTVELGTSLGLTTAYLASGNPDGKVITVEGSAAIQQVAMENWSTLGLANVHAVLGNFDTALPELLVQTPKLDLAYVDGNHRYAPTLNYFAQLLPSTHNDTILVFDDIHWSAEMEQAWTEIKSHPAVRCTIDIFFLGFVLFRSEFRERQHFVVRY